MSAHVVMEFDLSGQELEEFLRLSGQIGPTYANAVADLENVNEKWLKALYEVVFAADALIKSAGPMLISDLPEYGRWRTARNYLDKMTDG